MIEIENDGKQLRIVIPIARIEKLFEYQQGIMGLLRKIEIGECEPSVKESLKIVYELLSHLEADENFLERHEVSRKNNREG